MRPALCTGHNPHSGESRFWQLHPSGYHSIPATFADSALHSCAHPDQGAAQEMPDRELNRFLSVYLAKKDGYACRLISTMIMSTICGLYPHAKNQLCFAKMKHLVCSMKLQRETGYTGLVEWMTVRAPSCKHRSNPYAHQMLCFYAIREFTVHSVRRLPAMREGLCACNWRQFEQRVMFTCEAARQCVCDNLATDSRPMLSGVANTINNIHRSSKFETALVAASHGGAGAKCPRRGSARGSGCQPVTWTWLYKLFGAMRTQFIAKCKELHLRPVDVHRQRLRLVTGAPMECGIVARLTLSGVSQEGMDMVMEFLKLVHCGARKDALMKTASALLDHSPHEFVDLENECRLVSIKCSTRCL